ncbi:MAG: LytTR family transcriptional regulator [Bacteroidetes bacterium]|uniref:LytTR family transcriptional regulator n=1 Tax=Candidatus Cryptobacteroides faecigallinarum TaxID=2840763 RepID=A0A9D9INA4_9BACT|nr:LytTR family transcriptional regulator [Candidatus Cryptobacteroides faecigallinarum]
MNKRIPEYFLEKTQLIATVTFAVLFAIVFLNIYIPFSDTAWFRLGDSVFFLFTAGFAAISICILIASRILMYHSKKWFKMTYLEYVLWCFAEVVLICIFYTFVTVDVQKPAEMPPLQIFGKAFLYGVICLIIPYTIAGMYFAIVDKNRTIRLMSSKGFASDQEPFHGVESQITLFDNSGSLKLSIKSSSLYYIESDDNYIKVWYTDSKGELKKYMLRCRLKTIEDSFKGTSLIRCHRKYIVNSDKVKVLRKESEGYFLDLDNMDIPPIMVTKTYMENVLSRFSVSR